MTAPIHHIDVRDDGATVTVDQPVPFGIGPNLLSILVGDIRTVRRWTGAMTDDERKQIGPEVILLLRDVAPHLICTPMEDAR